MSDGNRTCEYVLDADDPETWGGQEGDECYVDEEALNEYGLWSCPHEVAEEVDGENLCLFHQRVDKKDDEKVVEAFLEVIESIDPTGSREHGQFLGAKFGTFKLSEGITVSQDCPINLSHAVFDEVEAERTEFECDIICRGTKFKEYVNFEQAVFRGNIVFWDVEFDGVTNFELAKFSDSISVVG
ncbi:hypothetical protein JCM18237_17370 [Halorubrum luteum]